MRDPVQIRASIERLRDEVLADPTVDPEEAKVIVARCEALTRLLTEIDGSEA